MCALIIGQACISKEMLHFVILTKAIKRFATLILSLQIEILNYLRVQNDREKAPIGTNFR